jgi:uroporphyrinogen-III synthase
MPSLLSTKKLQPNQRELLLNAGLSFVEYDAITTTPVDFTLPQKMENVIITSQNGAKAFLANYYKSKPVKDENAETLLQAQSDSVRFFVVGKKTTSLFLEKDLKVVKTAQNATELALFIAKNYKNEYFFYFCGNRRRSDLPTFLKLKGIIYNEIIVYKTDLNLDVFNQSFEAILFFSPSGVQSYIQANYPDKLIIKPREVNPKDSDKDRGPLLWSGDITDARAICIGMTTYQEADRYFYSCFVANSTTVESTIAKAVKTLK